jgi:hypothetical protein
MFAMSGSGTSQRLPMDRPIRSTPLKGRALPGEPGQYMLHACYLDVNNLESMWVEVSVQEPGRPLPDSHICLGMEGRERPIHPGHRSKERAK